MTHDTGTVVLTLEDAETIGRIVDYRIEGSCDCSDCRDERISGDYARKLALLAEKVAAPFAIIGQQKKRKELEERIEDLRKELNALPS